ALRDALVSVSRGYPPGGNPADAKKATGVTPTGVQGALATLAKNRDAIIDYYGASGPVDFDQKGDVTGQYLTWKIDNNGQTSATGSYTVAQLQSTPAGGPAHN